MKKHLALLLLITVCQLAGGQKTEPLPSTRPIIIKQLLGIPAAYTLISFDVGLSIKTEIFKTQNYGGELSPQAKSLIDRAAPGCEIFIENVLVQKDGKQVKWMGKTFVVQ